MIPQQKPRMTPQEYFEFEKNSELKHEYLDGEIFAMVGAKHNHTVINSNIHGSLWSQCKGTPCMVFSSDKRVKIEKIKKYTYPDIVIVCEEIKILEDELDSLVNPVVIIEILSNSTEAYDRGLKFQHYRLIESLQEYILISQYFCNVEKFKRSMDGTWILSTYTEMEKIVKIEPIMCELSLSEIYDRVTFDSSQLPGMF